MALFFRIICDRIGTKYTPIRRNIAMSILIKALPSTEKCFFDENFYEKAEWRHASCLRGEEFHFIVAYTAEDVPAWLLGETAWLSCRSELLPYLSFETVESVPVRFPCYPKRADDDYLRKTPGLYPDLLIPVHPGDPVDVPGGGLASLYVTVRVPETAAPGDYPITVSLCSEGGKEYDCTFTLSVIDAVLPRQTLLYTQWFHCDCIANAYKLDMFSEEHWAYIENYMRVAVENGVNAILTPVFTPPLDTAVGGERPTAQLVDVTQTEDGWQFHFDRLHRWIALCDKLGVEYLEISHFFTQWGAEHAPKIIANVGGRQTQVFGWETDSLSEEYIGFLRTFLTAFLADMKAIGWEKRLLFHISDEPDMAHLERYRGVKAAIEDLLVGYPILDALSDFDFYKTGAVSRPIPASNRIEPFLDAEIPELWTYYCCSQGTDVSNRFIAMPSSRTRIIGVQFWKYRIAGFLQWGYNYWYTRFSRRAVNPYIIGDGGGFTPSGDCCSVYPGPAGIPYQSLHMKAFTEALSDLRALRLAETLCGRTAVLQAVEGSLPEKITFSVYPRGAQYLLTLRETINRMIADAAR